MKRSTKLLIAVMTLIILCIASLIFYLMTILAPVADQEDIVDFHIESGSSSKDVLNELMAQDIIKDSPLTYYYMRLFHPSSFVAGDFKVDRSWGLNEILDHLSNQDNVIEDTVRLTFYEGEWLKSYAHKLAAETNVGYDELLALWNDESYVRSLMSDYPFLSEDIFNEDSRYLLEGYLFPDTYDFYRQTDADTITRTFLDHALAFYNENLDLFEASELSVHEIYTLASIVQFEGNNEESMKMIAGIFLNRLAIGMDLESSATVCYALDLDDDDNWLECEFNPNYDSPYNTYVNAGLPPGPILNPGSQAIMAVLEPTDSDYLFFMADICSDGQIYYSETYEEHAANVERYLTCY